MHRDCRYKGSPHFVWRQELPDILGEGAFGTVFKGVNKETGEPVAVKTFNRTASHRVAQYRELDIIKRLDHPNIVKLIAIEEVSKPRRPDGLPVMPAVNSADSMQGKVLIMELCTEESLYSNLDRPENQFGLDESEFLLVLAHMTSGMRYLHENKVIHRDWKPSNILKTITQDGEKFYKLCDFGAARVCDENGKFMSIVGTEEYLHPEIYGRALLGGSNGVFLATSDLWSIGVTLYQTATSLLPFRPYGGRKNRVIMHKMTTEKMSGVIAGFQESENGPIHWRRDLPAHCLLSTGLRPLVTKLLAGLLESKQPMLWNYERYFHEVTKILSKVVVRFYVLGEWDYRTVYLDRTADFHAFRDEVSSQIEPIVGAEFGMFAGSNVLDADQWDICDYANDQQKSMNAIIIVVPLNENACQFSNLCIPLNPIFIEHERPALDWDVDTAKKCLSVARWINLQLRVRRSLRRSITDTSAEIKRNLAQRLHSASRECSNWKFTWSTLNRHLAMIGKLCPSLLASGVLAPKHSSAQLISQALSNIEKQLSNLKLRCMAFANMEIPLISSEGENQESLAMEKTLSNMEAIYTQFRKDKAMRMDQSPETFYNDLKWHELQKKQLKKYWEWCKAKLDDAEAGTYKNLAESATACYRTAYQLAKTSVNIELGIRNVEEIMREFSASLDKLPEEPTSLAPALDSTLQTENPSKEFSQTNNKNVSKNGGRKSSSSKAASCVLNGTKIPESILDIVKELQAIRSVAQLNRQVIEQFPLS